MFTRFYRYNYQSYLQKGDPNPWFMTTGFLSMMFAFNVAVIFMFVSRALPIELFEQLTIIKRDPGLWFFGLSWVVIFFSTFISKSFKQRISIEKQGTFINRTEKYFFWSYYIISGLLFIHVGVSFGEYITSLNA